MSQVGIIERAFQTAPDCRSFEEVRRKLKHEGYQSVDAHLDSGALKKDLMKLLGQEAKSSAFVQPGGTGPQVRS